MHFRRWKNTKYSPRTPHVNEACFPLDAGNVDMSGRSSAGRFEQWGKPVHLAALLAAWSVLAALRVAAAAPATAPAEEPAIEIDCQALHLGVDSLQQANVQPDRARQGVAVTAEQVRHLVVASRSTAEGQHLAAPRITAISGRTASLAITSRRQYVVGYRATSQPDGSVRFEPESRTLDEGVWLELHASASADFGSVAIRAQAKFVRLLAMAEEPWPGSPAGQRLMIHKPVVETCQGVCSAAIRDGQTYLLALPAGDGKRADAKHVWVLLIRPTVVALRMEKDESER